MKIQQRKLKHFFEPIVLEIAENFKFNCRRQLAGEDIQGFVTALNNQSMNSNFGTFREKALRNQFVFGIESERIKSRLLETDKLDYKKAVEIALAMEISKKERNNLSVNNRSDSINYIHASKKPLNKYKKSATKRLNQSGNASTSKGIKSYRCNGDHIAAKCTKNNLFCSFCRRNGHNYNACFKKKKRQNVNLMDEEEDDEAKQRRYSKFRLLTYSIGRRR